MWTCVEKKSRYFLSESVEEGVHHVLLELVEGSGRQGGLAVYAADVSGGSAPKPAVGE